MEKSRFSNLLINWYKANKRDLPWRESQDSYRIWLSEVLLQQTRVAQGLPYYLRFLSAFPDINALATASEKEVLRLWQGLGYYSRARNLHAAAKTIVNERKGAFPTRYEEWLTLKGIGSYTAAAIASFANNEKVAVVDGNVFRVLARVYGINTDIASSKGKKTFETLANELLPSKNYATHNQAIMEFGALQCTPKNPSCHNCPLSFLCYAYAKNKQSELPVKLKKTSKTNRYFHYLVLKKGTKFLLKERAEKDIWKGLYEFPLLEKSELLEIKKLIANHFPKTKINTHIHAESRIFNHVLSHQNLHAKFWILDSKELCQHYLQKENFTLFTREEIHDLPKPMLINKFLEEYVF